MRMFLIIALILFNGCQKTYLTVQQKWIDKGTLASTFVGSPDPLQEDFPYGKKVLIGWDFPLSVYMKNPYLLFTVRLWDQTEHTYRYEIDQKRGFAAMFFSEKDPAKKLLTYKIDILDKEENILEVWEHQFWVELITSN